MAQTDFRYYIPKSKDVDSKGEAAGRRLLEARVDVGLAFVKKPSGRRTVFRCDIMLKNDGITENFSLRKLLGTRHGAHRSTVIEGCRSMGAKFSVLPWTAESNAQEFERVTWDTLPASMASIGCQLVVLRRGGGGAPSGGARGCGAVQTRSRDG